MCAMGEFFEKTFYGNTIGDWLVAAVIILGSVVAGKILYYLCSTVVRRMTARTRTKLDDIFVDMVEEPLVLAATIAGVWWGISRLSLGESVERYVGSALQVVLILIFVWLVSRLLDSLFREYLAPLAAKSETDLDDQLLPIVRKGTKIVVWTIGVIVALNNAGYNVGALIAGLGIGGLALAMAAKDTVANIFGGFTIFTDRPFSINDRVKVDGFDGTIKEIGVRSTRLETLEGRIVTIPNSKFSDSAVENVSLEPARKVVLDLGLTYDTSPAKMRRALELVREIAETNAGVDEQVLTAFDGFGDFAMNVKLIYWIKKDADILTTMTEVNLEILERFAAEGLDMAFPTQVVYTRNLEAA